MSSDFNYNFGFVVEEIFELGHAFDTKKKFVVWRLSESIKILFRFCCEQILLASAYYKHLYSWAQLLKKTKYLAVKN